MIWLATNSDGTVTPEIALGSRSWRGHYCELLMIFGPCCVLLFRNRADASSVGHVGDAASVGGINFGAPDATPKTDAFLQAQRGR